ncbi:MAG TPA: hypothetical protein VHS99_05250, partial [Chloroflexota bacterium]|nr:hypothetical protein [Chloroflexota bacterium]
GQELWQGRCRECVPLVLLRGRGRGRRAGLAAHGRGLDARETAPPPREPPGGRFLGVDTAAARGEGAARQRPRPRKHVTEHLDSMSYVKRRRIEELTQALATAGGDIRDACTRLDAWVPPGVVTTIRHPPPPGAPRPRPEPDLRPTLRAGGEPPGRGSAAG